MGGSSKKKRITAQWWEFQSCRSSYTETPFGVEKKLLPLIQFMKNLGTFLREEASQQKRNSESPEPSQFIAQYYAISPVRTVRIQTLRVPNTSQHF